LVFNLSFNSKYGINLNFIVLISNFFLSYFVKVIIFFNLHFNQNIVLFLCLFFILILFYFLVLLLNWFFLLISSFNQIKNSFLNFDLYYFNCYFLIFLYNRDFFFNFIFLYLIDWKLDSVLFSDLALRV
jgi:hypothetical protein